MIIGFAHPCLVVTDLELAREFYQAMFGFEVIGREGWSDNPAVDAVIGSHGSSTRGYMMAGHNCFLELFQYEAPTASAPAPQTLAAHEPGIRHLAFYVDDCRAEYQRCLQLGGQPLGTPAPRESGINAVYMRDPCGNIIELCEEPSVAERLSNLPGIRPVDANSD